MTYPWEFDNGFDDFPFMRPVLIVLSLACLAGFLYSNKSFFTKEPKSPSYPQIKIERAIDRHLIGDLDGDGIRELVLEYDSCGTRVETLYSKKYVTK